TPSIGLPGSYGMRSAIDRRNRSLVTQSVSARFLRLSTSSPPRAASDPATAPPLRAFGTAPCALRLAARFPIFTTSQPMTALRLLTMLMLDLRSLGRGYPIPGVNHPPGPAGGMTPEDGDEGTSC